jgi:hypothetical protein
MNRLLVAAVPLVLVAKLAHADPPRAGATKQACADAYTKAQTQRDAHKLLDARTNLRICAQAACPAFIVKDCADWMKDTEARIPGVVFSATDVRGNPMTDVRVSMDGRQVATSLDGEALSVDPGSHTFTFEAKDGTTVERPYVVLEGQKTQPLSASFAPAGGTAPVNEGASPTPASTTGGTFWTPRHSAGVIMAGVGAVGVVVGAIFGAETFSEASQQNKDCNGLSLSLCPNHAQALSDHSSAVTDGTVSMVGFIAGGALVAAGAVLLFTGARSTESPPSATSRFFVTPGVGPKGAGATLGAVF